MKRYIVIFAACCMLLTPDASYAKGGKFWKALGKMAGGIAEAATAVAVQRTIESCGYTQEESREYTRTIYEAFGSDCANVDRGLNYVTSEDKFAKENIAKDLVFDFVANVSDNQAFVESMRQMTDNTLGYMSAKNQATTDAERKAVIEEHTRRFSDIMYDTYQEAKERKAQRLSERMQLRDELVSRGQDPTIAYEMAGQILIISNDDSFTDEEKENYYRAYGWHEGEQQLPDIIAEVSNTDYDLIAKQQIEEERQRQLYQQEEERKKQEELQKQREAEEKDRAIAKINETVVSSYVFDQDALSDEQKVQLDDIYSLLAKYDDVNVELIGHTCKKGYKSVNDRIGLRRAETAKAYLMEKGVAEERITTSSRGEEEPKIANPTLEERKLNRRVEFVVK